MNQLKIIYGILAIFIYLPVHIYGSWLLYNHIHATELMWFIWWISIPFFIISAIVSEIIKQSGK